MLHPCSRGFLLTNFVATSLKHQEVLQWRHAKLRRVLRCPQHHLDRESRRVNDLGWFGCDLCPHRNWVLDGFSLVYLLIDWIYQSKMGLSSWMMDNDGLCVRKGIWNSNLRDHQIMRKIKGIRHYWMAGGYLKDLKVPNMVDLEFADQSDLGDTLFFFVWDKAIPVQENHRKPRNQLEHGFNMDLKGCSHLQLGLVHQFSCHWI